MQISFTFVFQVYEPKFNSELLAALLSIPTNKTLLRRHLSLRYRELIGTEIMEAKREACEADPDTQQLTPTAKVCNFTAV